MLLQLVGCGGDSGPAGPGGGGGTCSGTFFCATIDGEAWVSDASYLTSMSAGGTSPGSLVLHGQQTFSANNFRGLQLTLGRIEGPGTYPLGVDGHTVAGGSASLTVATGGATDLWSTSFDTGNDGSITVTSLSGGRIAGTFTFTAKPILGAGADKSITGTFNVPLPGNFVPATGVQRGSRMTGTINGTAWYAATVTVIGNPGAQQIGGHQAVYDLIMVPNTPQSEGTFQVGTGVTIYAYGLDAVWGNAGSTGSVTYTTLSATRAVGTFSATLTPVGGSTANLVIENGAFDVRLP